jgi:hypothetical protein
MCRPLYVGSADQGVCAVYRTLFDPDEIPADLRDFFEEVDAACGAPWVRTTAKQPTGEVQRKGASWDLGEGAHGHSPFFESDWHAKRRE